MSNSQHYYVTLLFAISIHIFCKTIDIAYYFTSNLVPTGAALFCSRHRYQKNPPLTSFIRLAKDWMSNFNFGVADDL
jgi:hypothetical protein